jgi:hypothetical protein
MFDIFLLQQKDDLFSTMDSIGNHIIPLFVLIL